MGRIVTCILLTLIIIYGVPFAVYSVFSFAFGLEPPAGVSPAQFLISILVIKIGTAFAFVLIFQTARRSLSGQWFIYAAIWWLMFVIMEAGLAIGPNYTWMDALAGMISETIYFPIIGWLADRLLGLKSRR